jgi:hypothetical protein
MAKETDALGEGVEVLPTNGPYAGEHTVTDLSALNNPLCLYNGQDLPIQLGTLISFEDTTSSNNWPVAIDDQGFPEIDGGTDVGTDTFTYAISNNGGSSWSDPGTVTTTLVAPSAS